MSLTTKLNDADDDESGSSSVSKSGSSNSSLLCFRRAHSEQRGRHLCATRRIPRGELIFCERPLLQQQSLENRQHYNNLICNHCYAFCGGPELCLNRRFDKENGNDEGKSREDVADDDPDHTDDSAAVAANSDKEDARYTVVPCRHACGHVYCSNDCEVDAHAIHKILCTGLCQNDDDALVQFKLFAMQSNELLLLVAEWWVAQHVLSNEIISDYTSFCMEPWENVAALELTTAADDDDDRAKSSDEGLPEKLRTICQEAAQWLNLVFNKHSGIPEITAHDVSIRMGSLEQNCMGVRQRHPLCRDVLDNTNDLRIQHHHHICQALAEAGFIDGDGDDESSNDGDDEDHNEDGKSNTENENDGNDSGNTAQSETEHGDKAPRTTTTSDDDCTTSFDYSVDEIAQYLATLFLDEDGSVLDVNSTQNKEANEEDDDCHTCTSSSAAAAASPTTGDDWDYLFPPFDGTAMLATACKMNHACNPNVVVLYQPRPGWGQRHALVARCVALQNISKGEELTISYIDAHNKTLSERREALRNYGFTCQCTKCQEEEAGESFPSESAVPDAAHPGESIVNAAVDDLFGSESDDEQSTAVNDDDDEGESAELDGVTALENRLLGLDTVANNRVLGSMPAVLVAKIAGFVQSSLQNSEMPSTGTIGSSSGSVIAEGGASELVTELWKAGVGATRDRDFCQCRQVGAELEGILWEMLQQKSTWPHVSFRVAYWCACVCLAMGLTHDGWFLDALHALDKAIVLGLDRSDKRLAGFVDCVELHAGQTLVPKYHRVDVNTLVPDFGAEPLLKQVLSRGLSQPLRSPIVEASSDIAFQAFQTEFLAYSKPLAVRRFASGWSAVSKWRDLSVFGSINGHRIVPIELGSMMDRGRGMTEATMRLRDFVETRLLPSLDQVCSLSDSLEKVTKTAYLAQHPLLSQIVSLQADLNMKPTLCGPSGPNHVNVWMGTGGTRTPLHYDSYDNWLVQIVGAKYVRLYNQSETSKLYVNSSSKFGLQGNMSEVNCEIEDITQHPLASDAEYTEVVLLPGDALFIPNRTWHYVRSLTTSISVNYWF